VLICKPDHYQTRIAFGLVHHCLTTQTETTTSMDLAEYEQRFLENDKLSKIQVHLDECHQILEKSIVSLLERGEALDRLLTKSADLSASSVLFAKKARKMSSCCKAF
jgi:hypothetical protein